MRRIRSQFMLVAAGAAGLLIHPSPATGQGGPPPSSVRVDAARMERVQEQRMVLGELRPVRLSSLAAEEPGQAVELAVVEGQQVKSGSVIARLDSKRLELELQQLEAEEAAAKAAAMERRSQMQWRQRDLETLRGLAEREAARAKEMYDAEFAATVAEAALLAAEQQVAVARARADLLRQRIKDMTITAPFDGAITARHIELGEWVAEGDPVVDLLSTQTMEAWLVVPQQFAASVMKPKVAVTIELEATGEQLTSTDTRSVPKVDEKSRMFALIARLDNSEGRLAPGMSIRGWVPTGQSADHLTISKNAILRNDIGPYVYVVRSSGGDAPPQAMPVNVNVLFSLMERVVIRSPAIAPGDLLVVEGNERLFPTAPVIPITGMSAGSAEAPGAATNSRARTDGAQPE